MYERAAPSSVLKCRTPYAGPLWNGLPRQETRGKKVGASLPLVKSFALQTVASHAIDERAFWLPCIEYVAKL
jgi:hypothetical protein